VSRCRSAAPAPCSSARCTAARASSSLRCSCRSGGGPFPFAPPHDHAPPPPGLVDRPEDDGDEAELEALFFVALTRARDLLVVSHAADYGGKRPAKPSRLLQLLAPARAAGLLAEERWTGGAGTTPPRRRDRA
jgi:hypothetical protein